MDPIDLTGDEEVTPPAESRRRLGNMSEAQMASERARYRVAEAVAHLPNASPSPPSPPSVSPAMPSEGKIEAKAVTAVVLPPPPSQLQRLVAEMAALCNVTPENVGQMQELRNLVGQLDRVSREGGEGKVLSSIDRSAASLMDRAELCQKLRDTLHVPTFPVPSRWRALGAMMREYADSDVLPRWLRDPVSYSALVDPVITSAGTVLSHSTFQRLLDSKAPLIRDPLTKPPLVNHAVDPRPSSAGRIG
jgi:hypothetical protein